MEVARARPTAPPEVLDRIYASALEPDAWPGALEAIAAAFDTEAGLVYSTYVFTTNVH